MSLSSAAGLPANGGLAKPRRAPRLGWGFGTSLAATFLFLTALAVPWAVLTLAVAGGTVIAALSGAAAKAWLALPCMWVIWGLYTRWLLRRAGDVDRGIDARRRMAALADDPVARRDEQHLERADRELLASTRYLRAELKTGESADVRTALVGWLDALRRVSPGRRLGLENLGLAFDQIDRVLATNAKRPAPLNPLLNQLARAVEAQLVCSPTTSYR